jgi:hypothetical protein
MRVVRVDFRKALLLLDLANFLLFILVFDFDLCRLIGVLLSLLRFSLIDDVHPRLFILHLFVGGFSIHMDTFLKVLVASDNVIQLFI